MADDIAYQNKDIIFKILSSNYPHVSMGVYGLNLSAVKAVLPSKPRRRPERILKGELVPL